MSEKFKLTDEEYDALDSFKRHCKNTVKYIEEYLEQMDRGIHDETLLYYIYADNARGIELIADWNVMWNEIRIIQELHKRFSKWEDEN